MWFEAEVQKPSSGSPVLAVVKVDGKREMVVRAVWIARYTEVSTDHDAMQEYHEEDDEFYIVEGWYECIQYWDEWSSVRIDDEVLRWQPMPSPDPQPPTWDECHTVALHLADELRCVGTRASGGDSAVLSMAARHAEALNDLFRMTFRPDPNPSYRGVKAAFDAFDKEMADRG